MSITYTEKTIAILVDTQGTTLPTTAMVASNGLAYHLTVCTCGKHKSHGYTISHVKTGRSVIASYFDHERQAKDFISKVDGLCDWTEDYPDPPSTIKQLVMQTAIAAKEGRGTQ